jgi:mono/diheme cytochrome c family protein
VNLSVTESGSATGSRLDRFHAAVLVQFCLEIASGFILSLFYRPANPYGTDRLLHASWLRGLQAFHYWQSALLIIESLGLVGAMAWSGRTQDRARPAFLSGCLIFFASMGFQLTGNVLPFDRHGVGTAVIESSIAARAPLVGGLLSKLALGGSQFSMETVSRWYLMHLGLTILAIVALALALRQGPEYRKRFRNGVVVASFLPALFLALCVASPLGSQATQADFSSFADRSSWYTQPLHGALILCSRIDGSMGWVGAMLIPGGFAVAFFALGWMNPAIARKVGRIEIGLAVAFFGVASLGFGGAADPLTGTRDPVEAKMEGGKAAPIDAALAANGRKLFNSVGCSDCHGADGLQGKAGPSLATVQNRHFDSAYFMKYVKNPQGIDPNTTMPAFPQLAQAQLRAIAEYLLMPQKPAGR